MTVMVLKFWQYSSLSSKEPVTRVNRHTIKEFVLCRSLVLHEQGLM